MCAMNYVRKFYLVSFENIPLIPTRATIIVLMPRAGHLDLSIPSSAGSIKAIVTLAWSPLIYSSMKENVL